VIVGERSIRVYSDCAEELARVPNKQRVAKTL